MPLCVIIDAWPAGSGAEPPEVAVWFEPWCVIIELWLFGDCGDPDCGEGEGVKGTSPPAASLSLANPFEPNDDTVVLSVLSMIGFEPL